MAINKKLINFAKESNYLAEKAAGNILPASIVFIDDAKKIVTHNTEFVCKPTDLSLYAKTADINKKLSDEYFTQDEIYALNTQISTDISALQNSIIPLHYMKTVSQAEYDTQDFSNSQNGVINQQTVFFVHK